MKILVAEDDRATRTRILSYLSEWGHEGVPAADGEEALHLFETGDISFVISDWQMPILNGLELVRRMRERQEERHGLLYAILLTSRAETKDVVAGIEAGADDFVTKPFDKDELRVRIKSGERILALESTLEARNRELQDRNREITAANDRMRESLRAAAAIQQSFLPERLPDTDRVSCSWRYVPCEELAGDTMNIIRLDETRIGIYVADVSGHGVPAALLSVHLSRILTRRTGADALMHRPRADGGYEITSPSAVASHLNQRFNYDTRTQQYFTFLYGILDLISGEFRYTSAGHPGPIVLSGESATIHAATPPAIGFIPDGAFTESALQLKTGDRLYLYSDGLFEVSNRDEEEFGEKRLAEALGACAPQPLAFGVDFVIREARAWMGGGPFPDDISLIALEIR